MSALKHIDQSGGGLRYFSKCILSDCDPAAQGENALTGPRQIESIREAIRIGGAVKLPPFARTRRIDPRTRGQRLGAPGGLSR